MKMLGNILFDMQGSDSQSTLNWGKASDSERSAYTDNCSELLGNIQLPREAVCCSLASCDDVSHIHSIASLYSDIVNCLCTLCCIGCHSYN